jgi:adenine-specific DNA-methyltransferase
MFRFKVDHSIFSNPDNDLRGLWTADPFDAPNIRINLTYPITNPNTGTVYYPPNGRCWRTTKEEYKSLYDE